MLPKSKWHCPCEFCHHPSRIVWEGRSRKAIIHWLYVIKTFTYNWFSIPLESNSFPTKKNRVGEIFIIVIIKQNAMFLATACNFAWKYYYTLQQQCRVIQALCLDNTWPWTEAVLWKWSQCLCVKIICNFAQSFCWWNKFHRPLFSKIFMEIVKNYY